MVGQINGGAAVKKFGPFNAIAYATAQLEPVEYGPAPGCRNAMSAAGLQQRKQQDKTRRQGYRDQYVTEIKHAGAKGQDQLPKHVSQRSLR